MRVRWLREGLEMIPLSEDVRRRVEEWVSRLKPEELRLLREYEETGDALVCPLVDPYEEGGLVVKLVRHKGMYMVVAGIYEGGRVEEYYVGEIV